MQLASDQAYSTAEQTDFVQQAGATNNSFWGAIGSTFGKAVDTALDVVSLNAKQKVVGTVFPTGSVDPAQVNAANAASAQSNQALASTAIKYVAIGGAVLVGVVLLVVLVRRK